MHTHRREPTSLVTRTRRLMKRLMAQHGGAHTKCDRCVTISRTGDYIYNGTKANSLSSSSSSSFVFKMSISCMISLG